MSRQTIARTGFQGCRCCKISPFSLLLYMSMHECVMDLLAPDDVLSSILSSSVERRHGSMCRPSPSPVSPPSNSRTALVQVKTKACLSGHNSASSTSKPFKTPKDNLLTSSSKQHTVFSAKGSRDKPWWVLSAGSQQLSVLSAYPCHHRKWCLPSGFVLGHHVQDSRELKREGTENQNDGVRNLNTRENTGP